jgi:predicted nucleic acid-binding protein
MSVVTQAELLAGVQLITNAQRREELLRLYHETVALATEVLPITSEVAERFARVYVALRRIGRPIDTNDIWIAAVALAHGLVLVTSDEHFCYIPDLSIEDWSQ